MYPCKMARGAVPYVKICPKGPIPLKTPISNPYSLVAPRP